MMGGGGLSASSSASGRSGDAGGASGTGNQIFNFGGNPNVQSAFQSPGLLIAGAVVLVAFFYFRRK